MGPARVDSHEMNLLDAEMPAFNSAGEKLRGAGEILVTNLMTVTGLDHLAVAKDLKELEKSHQWEQERSHLLGSLSGGHRVDDNIAYLNKMKFPTSIRQYGVLNDYFDTHSGGGVMYLLEDVRCDDLNPEYQTIFAELLIGEINKQEVPASGYEGSPILSYLYESGLVLLSKGHLPQEAAEKLMAAIKPRPCSDDYRSFCIAIDKGTLPQGAEKWARNRIDVMLEDPGACLKQGTDDQSVMEVHAFRVLAKSNAVTRKATDSEPLNEAVLMAGINFIRERMDNNIVPLRYFDAVRAIARMQNPQALRSELKASLEKETSLLEEHADTICDSDAERLKKAQNCFAEDSEMQQVFNKLLKLVGRE